MYQDFASWLKKRTLQEEQQFPYNPVPDQNASDAISAIDAAIKHLDNVLKSNKIGNLDKIDKIWSLLVQEWEEIKTNLMPNSASPTEPGLANIQPETKPPSYQPAANELNGDVYNQPHGRGIFGSES